MKELTLVRSVPLKPRKIHVVSEIKAKYCEVEGCFMGQNRVTGYCRIHSAAFRRHGSEFLDRPTWRNAEDLKESELRVDLVKVRHYKDSAKSKQAKKALDNLMYFIIAKGLHD